MLNIFLGDILYLKTKLQDECDNVNSIWSILTDKLLYCQSDTSDSVRHFSYDSLKAKNAKQRFFDADSAYINSCNAAELEELLFEAANSNIPDKKTLNTAEATASSNIPPERDIFSHMWRISMRTQRSIPHTHMTQQHVYVPLIYGQKMGIQKIW